MRESSCIKILTELLAQIELSGIPEDLNLASDKVDALCSLAMQRSFLTRSNVRPVKTGQGIKAVMQLALA